MAEHPFTWTAGSAINVAKSCTAAIVLSLAGIYGLQDTRKVVYAGLHLGYLTWWALHQWLAPGWWKALFGGQRLPQPVLPVVCQTIGIFGILYAAPAVVAFRNPSPISPVTAVLAIVLHIAGASINVAGDFYKTGQKQAGVKKVTTDIYDGRIGAHPNWAGDWLRYTSFALASGRLVSFLVPAFIIFWNFNMKKLVQP